MKRKSNTKGKVYLNYSFIWCDNSFQLNNDFVKSFYIKGNLCANNFKQKLKHKIKEENYKKHRGIKKCDFF
jgi:hypothetical protein